MGFLCCLPPPTGQIAYVCFSTAPTSPAQLTRKVSVPESGSGPYVPGVLVGSSTLRAALSAPVIFHLMIAGPAGARNTAVPSGHLGFCTRVKETILGLGAVDFCGLDFVRVVAGGGAGGGGGGGAGGPGGGGGGGG